MGLVNPILAMLEMSLLMEFSPFAFAIASFTQSPKFGNFSRSEPHRDLCVGFHIWRAFSTSCFLSSYAFNYNSIDTTLCGTNLLIYL